MNEKILPDDIESKSLSELTDIADRLIQELENKNTEAQKVISQEQRQASALYKKYPFIKEILTNRI